MLPITRKKLLFLISVDGNILINSLIKYCLVAGLNDPVYAAFFGITPLLSVHPLHIDVKKKLKRGTF